MPTRLIREGIIDSDRVNSLDWAEEVFYRRLLNKVDDHGLFDARPSYLKSQLYPVKPASDRVREADCSRWLAACEKAGLIVLYTAGGKPYLKAVDTRWQTRSEPKYPIPPKAVENRCKQLRTDVSLVGDVGEVVVVVEDGGKPSAPGAAAPAAPKGNGAGKHEDTGEVIERIPLCDGSEFEVRESFIKELDRLFPAVDPRQTLREIRAWNLSRPKRRKTSRGIRGHITSWFIREQDKQAGRPQ